MKFYDYPDNYTALKKSGLAAALGIGSKEEMYRWFAAANARADNPLGYRHMMFDMMWNREGRPYYDVYPSIIPMLTRLNLNFPGNAVSHIDGDLFVSSDIDPVLGPLKLLTPEQAQEMKQRVNKSSPRFTNLLIRLPEVDHGLSYEDPKHGHTPVRTIFISFQPVSRAVGSDRVTFGLVVGMDIGEREENGIIPMHTMRIFPLDERPIEDCIHSLPRHSATADEGMQMPDELMTTCIRLAITLCILEDNPDLIEPDVLGKDRHRLQNADEELRQRLIDKARRKGKYGFLVGKAYEKGSEKCPHSRMPHPCLFWTGPGRAVPIVKTRKGSLIHREKVESVPTGYQEDERPDQA
jgi:hypothetical protein